MKGRKVGKIGHATAAGTAYRVYRSSKRPGAPGIGARFKALPRMLRARKAGVYRGLTTTKLGLMILALVYIVSPVDALPEFLPLLGVTDDVGVFAFLVAGVLGETEKYLDWERKSIPGEVIR
ncbi:YkvA family protein [Bailinhaonella thermotolerans]|uniref:DUF1232 domain-containing protein n=1 Tax=Bailinhaonella thermotolerans TaxID=1070861 RepID=A0A3A4B223_9ACTN|nr:DUF1232 domain-containing protein [Bailinhaonella thermotolerans]RJL32057.1 DUF1232 domain-containing protein [Bailinhaonella thermotolerans]